MRRNSSLALRAALAAVLAAAVLSLSSACKKQSLGPDKTVAAAADTFKPKDTIFAVVSTDGSAPSSTIHVKWTYQGKETQTVKEDSRTISPTGPATSEFSIQNYGSPTALSGL